MALPPYALTTRCPVLTSRMVLARSAVRGTDLAYGVRSQILLRLLMSRGARVHALDARYSHSTSHYGYTAWKYWDRASQIA
eukprot:2818860-Rhodomonas_salina.2